GYLIGLKENFAGYIYAFMLTALLYLIVFIITFFISQKTSRRKRFFIGLTLIMARRYPLWRSMLFLWFVSGFLGGLTMFLPTLLLYDAFAREDYVSVALALSALVSVIASWYMSRLGTMERVPYYLFVCSIGIALGALVLIRG